MRKKKIQRNKRIKVGKEVEGANQVNQEKRKRKRDPVQRDRLQLLKNLNQKSRKVQQQQLERSLVQLSNYLLMLQNSWMEKSLEVEEIGVKFSNLLDLTHLQRPKETQAKCPRTRKAKP
jgi:hypothetical protein